MAAKCTKPEVIKYESPLDGSKEDHLPTNRSNQRSNLNLIKPLDLTMNAQEIQGEEEHSKSHHHQNVNCRKIYMTKESGY